MVNTSGSYAIASKETEGQDWVCEDRLLVSEADQVAFVVDGMGGPGGGVTAAETALKRFRKNLKKIPDITNVDERKAWLDDTVSEASDDTYRKNHKIRRLSAGSTAAFAAFAVRNGKPVVLYGNVGDARVYHYSYGGGLTLLTIDDPFIDQDLAVQVDNAEVWEDLNKQAQLIFKRRRLVAGALGHLHNPSCPFVPGKLVKEYPVRPDDKLILTSDGIHDNLTNREIHDLINETNGEGDVAQKLIDAAQERSRDETNFRAKPDDMTAVVIGPTF